MKTAKADVGLIRQQTQYTCVAASTAACIMAYGKDVDENAVNKVLGASALRGARWEEAMAALQYFGLRGHLVVPATLKMVKSWTDQGIPVMIAWNPEGRPWSHASVIFDVDAVNVHIMDPNCPNPEEVVRVVPINEFYSKWYEKFSDSVLIRRPALAVTMEVDSVGTPKPDLFSSTPDLAPREVMAGKKERERAKALKSQLKQVPKSNRGLSMEEKIRQHADWERRRSEPMPSGYGAHPSGKDYRRNPKHRGDYE
jgi:hypothetical protein